MTPKIKLLQNFQKILLQYHVPTSALQQVRKRSKQLASILTSPENIQKRKTIEAKTKEKNIKKVKKMKQISKAKINKSSKKIRACTISSSSDDSSIDIQNADSSDDLEDEDNTECSGCGENYQETKKDEDWIHCVHCSAWFHEHCSKYLNLCDRCGKVLAKRR